jgi:hypothetical protein
MASGGYRVVLTVLLSGVSGRGPKRQRRGSGGAPARSGRVIGILTVGLQHRTEQLADTFARLRDTRRSVTDQSGSLVARLGASANALLSLRDDPGVLAVQRGRPSSVERDGAPGAYAPYRRRGGR